MGPCTKHFYLGFLLQLGQGTWFCDFFLNMEMTGIVLAVSETNA